MFPGDWETFQEDSSRCGTGYGASCQEFVQPLVFQGRSCQILPAFNLGNFRGSPWAPSVLSSNTLFLQYRSAGAHLNAIRRDFTVSRNVGTGFRSPAWPVQ